jgi:hypothetical protein
VGSQAGYVYQGPDGLAAFAGSYYSEELDSTYQVTLDGGNLILRRGSQRQRFPLRAGPKDEFRVPGSVIRFQRGPNGAVVGLVVDADRTRGLLFEKR